MKGKIRPIRSDEDMREALVRLEEIFFAEPGTDEYDELEILGSLIHDYQAVHHPVAPLDPIEALEHLMQANNLKAADLIPHIGSAARVSEVLHGKRRLTIDMIRNLSREFNVSTDLFMGMDRKAS